MSCCHACCGIGAQFDHKTAQRELRKYRTKGPGPTTRSLRDDLVQQGVANQTLLDVGSGIGALAFELVERGVAHATLVDASPATLAAAREELRRRNKSTTVAVVEGDFVDVAESLPSADIVTLDRVICCYPDGKSLLDRSLAHATRLFALSYPRDRWFVRLAVRAENLVRRLRSNPFRTFVHSVAEMERIIRGARFELVNRRQTAAWTSDVYRRV